MCSSDLGRGGARVELGRYAVRIRNGSAYVAWADARGRLVRLIPLPWQEAAPGLTREGFAKAAAGLRPAPERAAGRRREGSRAEPPPLPIRGCTAGGAAPPQRLACRPSGGALFPAR